MTWAGFLVGVLLALSMVEIIQGSNTHVEVKKEVPVSSLDGHETWVKPVVQFDKPFLFVFDLDSTLIKLETIDELAEMAGVKDVVRKITKEAMEGRMNFEEALRARSKLLKGLYAEACWTKLASEVQFNEGAEKLVPILKNKGIEFKTAIVSGGFFPLADVIKERLGMDYAFANRLDTDEDGMFNGDLVGDIMTPERKRSLMFELAEKHSVPHCNIFAMGDGANDIPMITSAGVGVAYCAKPVLRQAAKYRLDLRDLTLMLTLLDNI